MMTMHTDRTQLSSSRLGFANRRASGVSGHRLPQRLVEATRMLETDLRSGLAVLRGSRFESAAPERF